MERKLQWVEKWRPKELNDLVGIEKLNIDFSNLPNLLFSSSAGTGKTTVAKIIIRKLNANALILNASDETSINVIRDKVKAFAMTKSTNGQIKIVFLDEAERLSPQAQDSLKNIIETYHGNCRFILTTNVINKITDPIISRCRHYRFGTPPKEKILERLRYISDQEGLDITDELLNIIIDRNYPDIRRCVNKLEELHILGRKIVKTDIDKDRNFIELLFQKIFNGEKFPSIRQTILDSNLDYEGVLTEMYWYLMDNKPMFGTNAMNVLDKIVDCNRYIRSCVLQEIEFEYMILEIMMILRK
ncbi:MAG: AAA family ATPase [bacterium]